MIKLLNRAGFTLLEMLLSIAIMVALVGLSIPVYFNFQTRNTIDITTQNVATALRRAQSYARSNNQDSRWSVEIQPTVATLFKDTDFSTRNTIFDETVAIPSSIAASGLGDAQLA